MYGFHESKYEPFYYLRNIHENNHIITINREFMSNFHIPMRDDSNVIVSDPDEIREQQNRK